MAKLAILGHATRGKEVIGLLEMLGGKNDNHCCGEFLCIYFINNYGYIESCDGMQHLDYLQLTLEEFFQKFPYRVGDKVQHKGATSYGSIFEVEKMHWEGNTVIYTLCLFGCNYKRSTLPAEYLQPYKEETMDKSVFDANAQCCDIMNHLIKKKTIEGKITMNEDKGTLVAIDLTLEIKKANEIEVILGDYEFVLKDGKTYFIKKNKYPKTYEECCKVLSLGEDGRLYTKGYKASLIQDFQKLLICRDAYWKIAGEQMGLGKPWKPSANDEGKTYSLYYNRYTDSFDKFSGIFESNASLDFPTEEMRDAFFENFKNLIESCKEFL